MKCLPRQCLAVLFATCAVAAQAQALERGGVIVCPSNASAARLAAAIVG